MTMDDKPERIVEFDRLNLLGKAIYAGGAVVRLTANAIDLAIDRTTDIFTEAERAFRQGADPNVDEARIIEEQIDPHRQARK